MNIEVIVKVQDGTTTQSYGALFEVSESETVIEDRQPRHGDDDYGRPVAKHPWMRAELVLAHLTDRVRGRAREALQERAEIEGVELRARQAAWDAEKKGAAPVAADVPF